LNPFKTAKPVVATFDLSDFIEQTTVLAGKTSKNKTLILELEKDFQVEQHFRSNSIVHKISGSEDFTMLKGTFTPVKNYIQAIPDNETKRVNEKANKNAKFIYPLIEKMAEEIAFFNYG